MAGGITVLELFKNGIDVWSAIAHFVALLIAAVGLWLALVAIVNYKNAGEGKCGVAKPILQTILASLMIASARFIPIITATYFKYMDGNGDNNFSPEKLFSSIPAGDYGIGLAMNSVLLFIQMLGVIAVLRSFLMVWEAINKGSGSGIMGKALTHFAGGVLAMNIQLTVSMVVSTFYPAFDISAWTGVSTF